MAGANLGTLSTILKEYYLGPVAEQLNNEVLLLSRLEAKSEDLVGKRAYVPLHWGRSSGVGARGEAAALPSAGKQQYEKAVYDLKYLYGRVEVTGPSMAKTKNEAGAFLQALKSELDGVRNDLKKDLARQVYGDGTATIATGTGNGNAGGTTILVGSEPIRKGQVYPGMLINVDRSGTLLADSSSPATTTFEVASVDVSAGTITTTVALASASRPFASGDKVRRLGVTTSSATVDNTYSLSDEIDGLQRIVASATGSSLGGITATGTATWWDNQRITASGASGSGSTFALTLEDIQKGLNLARIAGGMPTSVVTSLGVQREFYSLLQSVVRYVEPDSNLSYGSGFKALSYNGMPIIADIDAPYGKMYILDESTIKVFSDQDWHFLDADGLTLRQVTGYDKFEAVMARYMNLGANRRNNQVVINSIAVDGAPDAGF
jgi:hypothetical protein